MVIFTLMARVSKIKLDKSLENEIFKQFWYSLGQINNLDKSSDFFSDLLSVTEKLMLAKRFAIAVLLTRGKPTTDIHKTIHVSYTAIGSVSAWIKNARPETKKLLSRISSDKNWELVIDMIDELLDRISPRRHSDWREEYAKKGNRTNVRFAKKLLR